MKSAALVLDGNEQILHSNMAQGRISEQFTYLSIYRWLKVHFTHAAVSQSFKKKTPNKPAILPVELHNLMKSHLRNVISVFDRSAIISKYRQT